MFLRFFFLTHSLIDRCQIVTDTCKIMFQSLFGSLLNHFYSHANENVSVRYLSLICITSILPTFYSLKNCSFHGGSCRIYSPKSFGILSERISSSLKKINNLFTGWELFYYLCHHGTRFISSDSPLCLGIIFFNRRKTLRKVLLSYYLFSSGILRIIKTFHSRPISCLTQLLNCWWKLCIINFRWGSSSILFQFSRLNLPWCTLVNYIVGFLAHLGWKQWMRYLGGADVDGSCIRGRKLHCRPWKMITSNHISKLLKMQLESKSQNVHT